MRTQIILLASLALLASACLSFAVPDRERGPVDLESLAALIGQADRLIVRSGSDLPLPRPIYSSSDPEDIRAFSEALTIIPPDSFYACACMGTTTVVLFRGDDELLRVTNHHGISITVSTWNSGALVADQERWLRWFDARNIPGPRAEAEREAAINKKAEADEARWLEAMPASVREVWMQERYPDAESLREPLARELPEPRQRILSLFAWYGSGSGPWSGFPAYEETAEALLLDFPTAELIVVVESADLSAAQTEGAARLFGGWNFSRKRPADLGLLSPELKEKLLQQALRDADDKDKIGRARNAFEQR